MDRIARVFILCLAAFLAGCSSMKPEDFAQSTPRFQLERYFAGQTRAWGMFIDRFGTVKRQFVVDLDGQVTGNRLVLTEDFRYDDGETERRVWTIDRIDEHTYEGRAADVVGVARGRSFGNALNWTYTMDMKVGDGTLRVNFDDWMFQQDGEVLLNRAEVSKFGVTLGQVQIFFRKPPPQQAMAAE
ncbi:MAG TPA: DUF3833 domain-containing protein [Alphaproteobacteria bacterium]|nr:DUF3833 domain-containing protein [Alphaproteobacteria bacterium]